MKFRFHVLGLPHTRTNKDFTACAYTQKALKFCKMMKDRGHYIIHYGTEGSDPECDENVTVLSNEVWNEVYGEHDYTSKFFTFDMSDKAYQTFFQNAIVEVGKRKQPNDFILPFWGAGVRPVCDAHEKDMIVVEPGIGYSGGSWCQFRIFESYSLMHAYMGLEKVNTSNIMNWYEIVIPNYFDLKDFEYSDQKEDYMFFIGRVYSGKGVNIAMEMCERLGVKLKIAGQLGEAYEYLKDESKWPPNVEYVGYCDAKKRSDLMKGAKALICPSTYAEPFGGVQVEAMLCGTPVISTDWGAFTEVNLQGKTGYRCRTMGDFVEAGRKCLNGEIKYEDCRARGEEYSLENIAPKYEKYFKDVWNVYNGAGWYADYDDAS